MSRHIYTLKKPAGWHKELWREALPLGNGLTGALIPGMIGTECITLNRHDLWEGGAECKIPDVSDTIRAMQDAINRGDFASANRENLGAALQQKGGATPIACPHPLGWLEIAFAPEMLKVLCEMGHGDRLVIADANFPAASMGKDAIVLRADGHNATELLDAIVLRADGHNATELLDAILTLFPLDTYVSYPVSLMQVIPGDPVKTPIWNEYKAIVAKYDERGADAFCEIERMAFYEQSKKVYAIIATGEKALYANLILQKGVI